MAFTTITADTALNDLDLALEIAVALNKRCAVAGVTGITVPEVGTNFRSFIRAAQEKIQAVAPSFSNPSATLAGQSSLPSSWTLGAAMTAAGLTASGYWRRIPAAGSLPASWSSYSDAAYSYGLAAEDDLIGPWLYADLMAALSKLTRHASDPSDNDVNYLAYDLNHPPPEPAPFELSGTVTLSTMEGDAYDGKTAVQIVKEVTGSVHDVLGLVSAMRLRLPRRDITGATETRTMVYIPRGDLPFTSITGLSAGDLGKTQTASPSELETGYAVRWLFLTGAAINALSVAWSSLSSQLVWPSSSGLSSSSVYIDTADCCLVTDYDYGDGATS